MAYRVGHDKKGKMNHVKPFHNQKQYGYGAGADGDAVHTDEEMKVFLKLLDESADIEVTTWEAGFMDSILVMKSFTTGQKTVIYSLISKYGHRIKEW